MIKGIILTIVSYSRYVVAVVWSFIQLKVSITNMLERSKRWENNWFKSNSGNYWRNCTTTLGNLLMIYVKETLWWMWKLMNPYGFYQKTWICLLDNCKKLLSERYHLLSTNNELENEMLKRNNEIEETKHEMWCFSHKFGKINN